MMKRILLAALSLSLALCVPAMAQGQSVTIATTFSGYDVSTQAYTDALQAWETQSGFVAEDYSGVPDDAWQENVEALLSSGSLDILYTASSLPDEMLLKLMPVSELKEAYPDLPAKLYTALAASDGQVYVMPVRYSFTALYVNSDIFVENGIELPTTWDALLTAVDRLKAAGVTPIANALSDWPSCLFDSAVLAAGTSAQYMETEALSPSYAAGMELIRTLYTRGAFGDNALTASDMDAEAAFLSREAAMRVDGEWLCESVLEDQWNNTVVLPFPSAVASQENARIASANAGFYVTRAAFDDPVRREAAISLLQSLLSEPAASSLFLSCGDSLMQSARELLTGDVTLCPLLMDVVSFERYDALMLQVGQMASGEADISETIKAAF